MRKTERSMKTRRPRRSGFSKLLLAPVVTLAGLGLAVPLTLDHMSR